MECRICNPEVAGSNLGRGYFAPRSTEPSIPPGSVNEYKLHLERQRQVWLIPIAVERVYVHAGKTLKSLRTHAIPERFCGGDSLRRGAISSVCNRKKVKLTQNACSEQMSRYRHSVFNKGVLYNHSLCVIVVQRTCSRAEPQQRRKHRQLPVSAQRAAVGNCLRWTSV